MMKLRYKIVLVLLSLFLGALGGIDLISNVRPAWAQAWQGWTPFLSIGGTVPNSGMTGVGPIVWNGTDGGSATDQCFKTNQANGSTNIGCFNTLNTELDVWQNLYVGGATVFDGGVQFNTPPTFGNISGASLNIDAGATSLGGTLAVQGTTTLNGASVGINSTATTANGLEVNCSSTTGYCQEIVANNLGTAGRALHILNQSPAQYATATLEMDVQGTYVLPDGGVGYPDYAALIEMSTAGTPQSVGLGINVSGSNGPNTALDLIGGDLVVAAGNIDGSGSSGFTKTTTGAVSLNGNTTVAAGKTLYVGGTETVDGGVQSQQLTLTPASGSTALTLSGAATTTQDQLINSVVTTGKIVSISDSAITTGNAVYIATRGTQQGSGLAAVSISESGGTTAGTQYGTYTAMSNASTTNIGAYYTVSGAGTNNYAIDIGAGDLYMASTTGNVNFGASSGAFAFPTGAATLASSQTSGNGLAITANSMTTGKAFSVVSNSMTSGNAFYVNLTGAQQANGEAALSLTESGGTTAGTMYGAYVSLSNASTENDGLYLNVSSATTNDAIKIGAGDFYMAAGNVKLGSSSGTFTFPTGSVAYSPATNGQEFTITGAATTGNDMAVTNSTVTTGALISATSTGAGHTSPFGFKVAISGSSGNTLSTGGSISVTDTGTANTALALTASGATNNHAVNITAGDIEMNGSAGSSGQVLTSGGAGVLPSWTTVSGFSLPTSVTDSTTTTGNSLAITESTLTSGSGILVQSSTLSTGSLIQALGTNTGSVMTGPLILAKSTATLVSSSGIGTIGIQANMSGANSSSAQSVVGFDAEVSNSGSSSTNNGIVMNVTGATANHAMWVRAGDFYLNNSAGNAGQVLVSSGANTVPSWNTVSSLLTLPLSLTDSTTTSGTSLAISTNPLANSLTSGTMFSAATTSTAQSGAKGLSVQLSGTMAADGVTNTALVVSNTDADHGGGTGINKGATITSTGQASNLGLAIVANEGLAGGALASTASSHALDITGTWNTSGAPVGIFENITNTASTGGLLEQLEVGGTSMFKVDTAGNMTAGSSTSTTTLGGGIMTAAGWTVDGTTFGPGAVIQYFTGVTGGGSGNYALGQLSSGLTILNSNGDTELRVSGVSLLSLTPGSIGIGANDTMTAASGTGSLDWSAASGVEKTTSGAFTFTGRGSCTPTLVSGVLTCSSDARLKTVDGAYLGGLGEVLSLRPARFHWNDASGLDTSEPQVGFIAQDVERVLPEAVGVDANGMRTLIDRPIEAALVNSVQEIEAQVLECRADVAELQDEFAAERAEAVRLRGEVADLRARVARLEQFLGARELGK